MSDIDSCTQDMSTLNVFLAGPQMEQGHWMGWWPKDCRFWDQYRQHVETSPTVMYIEADGLVPTAYRKWYPTKYGNLWYAELVGHDGEIYDQHFHWFDWSDLDEAEALAARARATNEQVFWEWLAARLR